MSEAFDYLCAMRLEGEIPWGEAASRVQLDDAHAVLDGEKPYHFCTRSRGYSKTTDAAGESLAMLMTAPDHSRLYWLAADRDQGLLALDSIAGFAARTPGLVEALELRSSSVVALDTGSMLTILAADAPGSWGLRPYAVFVDELSQWAETPRSRALWESVSSAVTKVKGARMAVLTTAGSPSHFAAKVLEHAKRSELWRVSETPGPAPWMDPDRLAEQRARLPAGVYAQLFENVWTQAEGAFLSPEALDGCFSMAEPPLRHNDRSYTAALDLGHVNDRTAFCIGHRESGQVVLDRMYTWTGSPKAPVSFEMVESQILAAHSDYRFRLSLDPWQGYHLAERLRRKGVSAKEVNFSPAFKQRLASTLLQAVNDELLRLYPAEGLREELLALKVKATSNGWTFDHAAGGHDDRAVALALMTVAALGRSEPRSDLRARVVGGPVDYSRYSERLTRERRGIYSGPSRPRIGPDGERRARSV